MLPSPRVKPLMALAETTPLLINVQRTSSSSRPDDEAIKDAKQQDAKNPLPRYQLLLLCFARLTEPVAFFSIFPYIAQMVERNGNLPSSDVGFYSGIIESLFSISQIAVTMPWAALADRFGRKTMLVYSLIGMAVGPALFGMSTSLWQMALLRCFSGAFSGADMIIRTMVGEHSALDVEARARAFSWYAFAGNVGVFLGPIIGGALVDPVNQYPFLFGGSEFLEQYPFALPGLVVGVLSALAALSSAMFLKQTHQKDGLHAHPHVEDGIPTKSNQNQPPCSIWQIIKAPRVGLVLGIYLQVMLLAYTFEVLLPVVLYTSVNLGGLAFSSSDISLYMGSQGGSLALWLLVVFPILQRRSGTRGVLKACASALPFFFAFYILMNALLRQGSQEARVCFWLVLSGTAVVGPGVWMATTGTQLALNEVAPSTAALGVLNAIAVMGSNVVRSVVPGIFTAVFAVGVREQILAGQLAWVILILLSGLLLVSLRWLPAQH